MASCLIPLVRDRRRQGKREGSRQREAPSGASPRPELCHLAQALQRWGWFPKGLCLLGDHSCAAHAPRSCPQAGSLTPVRPSLLREPWAGPQQQLAGSASSPVFPLHENSFSGLCAQQAAALIAHSPLFPVLAATPTPPPGLIWTVCIPAGRARA